MTPKRPQHPSALSGELEGRDPGEISDRLKGILTSWLTSQGLSFEEEEQPDGEAGWRLVVQISEDWSVQIANETASPDRIVVGSGTTLNEYHRRRIREEPPEVRRRLYQRLRGSLHSEVVERSLQVETEDGEHPSSGVPKAFVLRRIIFADGLTKHRFFESITRVHSVRIRAVTAVQSWYGTSDQPLDPVL